MAVDLFPGISLPGTQRVDDEDLFPGVQLPPPIEAQQVGGDDLFPGVEIPATANVPRAQPEGGDLFPGVEVPIAPPAPTPEPADTDLFPGVELPQQAQPQRPTIPAALAPREGIREIDRTGLTPIEDTGVAAGLGRSLAQGAAEAVGGALRAGQEITTGRGIEDLLKGVGVPEEAAQAVAALGSPFAIPARVGEAIGERLIGVEPTKLITNKLRDFAQEIQPRITGTQGIIANAQEGNFAEAGKQLGFGVARNIPQLALLFATGGGGLGISVLGASAAGQKLQQLEADNPDINPALARANAIGTGVVEAVSERLGSAGIVKRVLGGRVFRGGVKAALFEVLRDAGIEGAEEAAAQIGGNIVDMLTRQKDVSIKGIFEGIGDAAVIGAVMGGGVGAIGVARGGQDSTQIDDTTTTQEQETTETPIEPPLEQAVPESEAVATPQLDTEAGDVGDELVQPVPEPAAETPIEDLTTTDPRTGVVRPLTLAEQHAERTARERRASVEQGDPVDLPALNRFGQWLSKWIAFGEARIRGGVGQEVAGRAFNQLRSLAQRLHSFQQQAQADVQTALAPLTQERGRRGLTGPEDIIVTFLMEEGGGFTDQQIAAQLTPEQQELFGVLSELRDTITQIQKEAGVLTQETIDNIDAAFGGYMPQNTVAKAYLQILADKLTPGQRRNAKSALRRFYGKRNSNLTLRDYANMTNEDGSPVFDRELFDPIRMTTDLLRDGYSKIALEETIRWGRENGFDVDSKANAGPDFVPVAGNLRGVSTLGMQGRFMHRLWIDALNEIGGANKTNRGALDKLLTITKIGQFFVPGIIWTYNELQGWQRGLRFYRLWKNPQGFFSAVNQMIKNPEKLARMQALGAVQNPGRANLQSQQDQSELFARSFRRDVAPLLKATEAALGRAHPVKAITDAWKRNKGQGLLEVLQLPYRAINKLAWIGDSVQRIQSFDTYMETTGKDQIKAGVPLEEVERAAGEWVGNAHGAYGTPSQAYRDFMHKIFFVHTFRVLMPIEIGKSVYGLPIDMYKKWAGKENVPNWKLKREARAFVNTIATPIAITMMMAANGWEPDNEGLPDWIKELQAKGTIGDIPIPLPFPTYKNHWKFKKTIVDENGQHRELVVGISDIVNMPVKWLSRMTKDRPQRLDDTWYHLLDVGKWEVNPIYRIGVDLVTNEPSMGGKRPADRTDPILKQVADASWYAFSNMFRMYGLLTEVRSGDTAYRRQVRSDLDKGLNIVEKALLGYYAGYTKLGAFVPTSLGYTYSRSERRVRFRVAREQLKRAIAQEKGVIKRESRDKPDEIRRRLTELNAIQVERSRRLHRIFLGDRP